MQNGFKGNIAIAEDLNNEYEVIDNAFVFHDLTGGVDLKMNISNSDISPFIETGILICHSLFYSDMIFKYDDKEFGYYDKYLKDFRQTVLFGTFGIGINFKNKHTLVFNMQHSFTDRYKLPYLKISGFNFGIMFGMIFNS